MKNTLKNLTLMGVAAATISTAQTADYQCFAKANPERGFTVGMHVLVEKAVGGGKIALKIQGIEKTTGIVNEVQTVHRANPDDTNAFDAIIRLVGLEDVSGLKSSQLGRVSHISVIEGMLTDGQEIYLYRLFAGSSQIGGTVLVAGFGTACR